MIHQLNPPSHTALSQLDSSHPFLFSSLLYTTFHTPPTRYIIQHLLRSFPLSRYLFPFSGTTHKPNIAFLGLLKRATPLPLCQTQARVALTLFEKLDQGPENSNIDGTQEYLDILTRYEMLKLKAVRMPRPLTTIHLGPAP